MKTLFLNPPSFQGFDGGAGARWQARREVRSFWYPTWLAQAAALVEDSRLVDAAADDLAAEDVLRIAQDYELVVVFTSTPSLPNDARLAERIRSLAPRILIGMVGPHVSVLPEESLRRAPAVDFVVRREFEYAVQEVASGVALEDVPGISWRNGDTIVHNLDRPLLQDLDTLPSVMPVYERDLTLENYYIGYLQHPYLSFYAGRGCAGRCTYCLWPQTMCSRDYRVRSPELVYEDFLLAKRYFPQVKEFFIDDDTFTADPHRAEEIARRIAPLGVTWSASTRCTVSHETMKVLKDCGLRLLMVGYESGSDQILRNIRKGLTTDTARRFARGAKDLGIAVHGCFIVGLPGESRQTVEETLRFACELDPDTIQVALPAPYPGTEFYRQAVDNGWLVGEGLVASDGSQSCPISYAHFTADDISRARDMIYKRFYFRPKVMLRIGAQMLKDRQVRRRRIEEGRQFLQFLKHRPDGVKR